MAYSRKTYTDNLSKWKKADVDNLQDGIDEAKSAIATTNNNLTTLSNAAFKDKGVLTSATDFNTVTTVGIYSYGSIATMINAPSVSYGVLEVVKSSSYVIQKATSVTNGITQTRASDISGGTWTAWKTTTVS